MGTAQFHRGMQEEAFRESGTPGAGYLGGCAGEHLVHSKLVDELIPVLNTPIAVTCGCGVGQP